MKCYVLVGGFSNTIEVFELSFDLANPEAMTLLHKDSSTVGDNPSFLTTTPDGIYSIHEVKLIFREDFLLKTNIYYFQRISNFFISFIFLVEI